jgi:hypothetical protein
MFFGTTSIDCFLKNRAQLIELICSGQLLCWQYAVCSKKLAVGVCVCQKLYVGGQKSLARGPDLGAIR